MLRKQNGYVSSRYIPDVREAKADRAHRSPIHIAQQLGGVTSLHEKSYTFLSQKQRKTVTSLHARHRTNHYYNLSFTTISTVLQYQSCLFVRIQFFSHVHTAVPVHTEHVLHIIVQQRYRHQQIVYGRSNDHKSDSG